MYTAEQIFIWDIEKLRALQAAPTEENLLNAAGILRRLLMDGSSSVFPGLAKKHGLKPQFEIRDSEAARNAMEGMLPPDHPMSGRKTTIIHGWVNIAPTSSLPTKMVDLGAFLATTVDWSDDVKITVADQIYYVANVGGGVHHGTPNNKHNTKTIHPIAGQIRLMDKPFPVQNMVPILTIVLAAVAPLYETLKH